MRIMQSTLGPLMAAALLAGCAAPQFPRQAAYPFGMAAAQQSAKARGAGAPSMVALQCPGWEQARLSHPIDAINGNPLPAESLRIGCHNQAALDAMVARPSDLTAPPARMSPGDAAAQNRAIERRRTIGLVPLPEPQRASAAIGG